MPHLDSALPSSVSASSRITTGQALVCHVSAIFCHSFDSDTSISREVEADADGNFWSSCKEGEEDIQGGQHSQGMVHDILMTHEELITHPLLAQVDSQWLLRGCYPVPLHGILLGVEEDGDPAPRPNIRLLHIHTSPCLHARTVGRDTPPSWHRDFPHCVSLPM